MRQRNTVYVRVLLVILSVVVLLIVTGRGARHPHRDTWLPSSYNPVGAGSMALFETLQELHWPVDRWREPLSRLDLQGTGNVLVVTRAAEGSPPAEFTEQEDALLAQWVKEGNTLVLLGAFAKWNDTRGLLQEIGFTPPNKPLGVTDFWRSWDEESRQTIALRRPGESPAEMETLQQPRTDPLYSRFPPDTKVLWQHDGLPFVVQVTLGRGSVIYGASERLLSRTCLEKGGNMAAVLPLLMPGGGVPHHLFFEETHHGFSGAFALVRLLEQPGLRFAGLLALLGTLAFLGSSLVRFGPVIPLHRAGGRSALEFVDSIADLYLRADLRQETIQYLFAETHRQLVRRLDLPASASHAVIASRLEQSHPHLPKWKKLAQRFDSNDYVQGLAPSGWVRVARDLIEIKTALA